MSREAMKQPEAFRLADNLGKQWTLLSDQVKAAVELRRLHEVNQDLLKALHEALETEQKPVAWISEGGDVSRSKRYMDEMGFKCNPLYTAPPKQWVSLTDEEVWEAIDDVLEGGGWLDVARALEAAIKEKNK